MVLTTVTMMHSVPTLTEASPACAIQAIQEMEQLAQVSAIHAELQGSNQCADIDECTDGTDNCHDDAQCTNTDGSFTCMCNSGYMGDGTTCTGKYNPHMLDSKVQTYPTKCADVGCPSVSEEPMSAAVVAGGHVEFTCVFHGQPTVIWLHNNEEIEPDNRVCISEDTSAENELRTTLTIWKTVPDDCGSYTCTGEFEMCDTVTGMAELVVQGEFCM